MRGENLRLPVREVKEDAFDHDERGVDDDAEIDGA